MTLERGAGARGRSGSVRDAYHRLAHVLVPLVVLLSVTLPYIGEGDFHSDTARYAAIGLQMWRTGDLACPRLHPSQPYFNKPPLALWIHGLALHLAGPSLAAARAPSVLAAAGCVALTVLLVSRHSGRRVGAAAGVILALTLEFFRHTRHISLDLWQLVFLLAAALLVAEAIRRSSAWRIAAAGLPIGLALMCKPVVAFTALPVFGIWLGLNRRGRWIALLVPALLVAATVAAPWRVAMWLTWGDAYLGKYMGAEIGGRALGFINPHGPLYYAVEIGRTYWPWMIPLASGLVSWRRGGWSVRRRRGAAMAAAWLAVWLAALTLFPDKRPRYELPLYPAFAWIAAEGLVRIVGRGVRRWILGGFRALAPAAVGLALLAVLPVARVPVPKPPHWAALFDWMRGNGIEIVWAGRLGSNAAARFYLEFGRWPEPIGPRNRPPPGAHIVYHERAAGDDVHGEEPVFRRGPILVTRVAGLASAIGSDDGHPSEGAVSVRQETPFPEDGEPQSNSY